MKQRIEWIDIAKGIGIGLMIFNHITLQMGQDGFRFLIASFHMPLFFVLSGLTLNQERITKAGLWDFVKKRFLKILVPYFIWALIYARGLSAGNLAFILYGNNLTLRLTSDNAALWFLPCLFVASILSKMVLGVIPSGNKNIWCLVPLIAIFAWGGDFLSRNSVFFDKYGWPLSFDIALIGTAFMLCGQLLRIVFIEYQAVDQPLKRVVVVGVSFALTLVFAYTNTDVIGNSYGRIIMAKSLWGNLPLFLCSGVSGSIMIFTISMILGKCAWPNKILTRFGRETLIILAVHGTVLKFTQKVIELAHLEALGVLIAFLISLAVLCISYVIAIIARAIAPSLAEGNINLIREYHGEKT